jgi:hypothetical protein
MLGASASSDWAQVAIAILLGLLTAYLGLSIRLKRRQEIAVSVSENRFGAYADLWSKIPVSPELMKLTKAPPLTNKDLRKLFDSMTVWYYTGGHGMLLGTHTRVIYLTVKTNLICDWDKFVPVSKQSRIRNHTDARSELVIRQLSLLRTAMRADLELYGKSWGKSLEDDDREFLYACQVSGFRVQRGWAERGRWMSDKIRGRTNPKLYKPQPKEFFVPHTRDPDAAERVWEATRTSLEGQGFKPMESRRIFRLDYHHDGKRIEAEVGVPPPYGTKIDRDRLEEGGEPQEVLLIFECPGGLYLVSTWDRGAQRGDPILVKAGEPYQVQVTYFDGYGPDDE